MATEQIITRYRPAQFKEILGQEGAVRAVEQLLDGSTHNFMFSGPPGVGKTTLAKVAAGALGCTTIDEIDAVSNSGVDEMRERTRLAKYPPLEGGSRAIIVDECHGLSQKAWESLLIELENPAPFNFWFFSTTTPQKMPIAVKQRCVCITLVPVNTGVIEKVLWDIADAEKWDPLNKAVTIAAAKADGSVRQGIQNLLKIKDCNEIDEVYDMLDEQPGASQGIDLARALVKHARWPELIEIAKTLPPNTIESTRYLIVNYVAKVVVGAKGSDLENGLAILRAFSKPFASGEGLAPLLLAIAEIMDGRSK
jgi:DNA polymerase III gamma/tau subunit